MTHVSSFCFCYLTFFLYQMQVIGMKLAFGLSSAVISIELGFLDQARVPLHSFSHYPDLFPIII